MRSWWTQSAACIQTIHGGPWADKSALGAGLLVPGWDVTCKQNVYTSETLEIETIKKQIVNDLMAEIKTYVATEVADNI